MNQNTSNLILYIPVLGFLLILALIMPKLSRKELFFGIRLPEDKEIIDIPELKKIHQNYIRNILFFSVPYALMLCIILFYHYNPFTYTVLLFGLILINSLIYYNSNRKTLAFKKEQGWDAAKKQVVVIDTKFSKDKEKRILVSPLWFLLCLILIVFNIYIGYKVYDKLPNPIPTHWNSLGEVDGWTNKSHKIIFQMPATQFFVTIIIFFTYKSIGWAKQQVNASNPEESLKKNRHFRFLWSGFMVFMAILLNILFTFMNFNVLQIIKISGKTFVLSVLLFGAVIMLAVALLTIKTGQGGSKIKLKNNNSKKEIITERNDDKYWKLGLFYVNPNDPSIFIEKRFGVGWTMNYGKITSYLILIALFGSIALFTFIMRLLS